MLRTLFSNRLFLGALAFFVLCVGGSLLYMQHIRHQDAEKLAETQDRVEQWNERQNPTTQVKAGDTSQGGHFHADGSWHDGPRESKVQPTAEVNPSQPQDSPLVIVRTPPIPDASKVEELNVPSHESLQAHYKVLSEWRKKHDEASAEWTAAIENVLQVLPKEGLTAYLENLSDAERQELSVKIDDLIEKRKAASEKLRVVRQGRPVRPQN